MVAGVAGAITARTVVSNLKWQCLPGAWLWLSSFNPHDNLRGVHHYYPHLTDGDAEALAG